jgi:hypothetical protein
MAALLIMMLAGSAFGQAVDANNRACLEILPSGTSWLGASQLYCLKPDPMRTRRDPFGRCQERRFEVTLKNACEYAILVRWRFNTSMAEQRRPLGPNQSFVVDCGQLSDRCDGGVLAFGDKLAN